MRILTTVVLCVLVVFHVRAEVPGAPPEAASNPVQSKQIVSVPKASAPNAFSTRATEGFSFNTSLFTFSNITLFSYFNGSEFTVSSLENGSYNEALSLNANEQQTLFAGRGLYLTESNNSYTVLAGDALTSVVQGFFAVDQSGLGTSTLLNTYMVNTGFGEEKFIVFAYQAGTEVVIRDLDTDTIIFAGSINDGEHIELENVNGTFLQVSASKPVSALSYGDQDYYVPSSAGTFIGQKFHGYSAYIGNWENSITVIAYEDETEVTVTDTVSGEVIRSYSLQQGQVNVIPIDEPTYWTVESSKPVTAANIPITEQWTANYAYMARVADNSGRGAGTRFYFPTIASRIDIFSYEDDNEVKVTRLGGIDDFPYENPVEQLVPTHASNAEGVITMSANDVATFQSPVGRNVYEVTSTGPVSVLQSNNQAGADFIPLNFALNLPDLSISSNDVEFSPNFEQQSYQIGDEIQVEITVNNLGTVGADDIRVAVYEGDPDEGVAPLVFDGNIDAIPARQSGEISFNYVIPALAEYRYFVIIIDPDNTVVESNSSNNKANVPLVPNEDLLPPISAAVSAPDGLQLLSDGSIGPNPFTVRLTMFNNGEVAAEDVMVTLVNQDGINVSSGESVVDVGSIPALTFETLSWQLEADENQPGYNRYDIVIESSNAPNKIVRRVVNVPDTIAPASPDNVRIVSQNNETNSLEIAWDPVEESDILGYQVVSQVNGVSSILEALTSLTSLLFENLDETINSLSVVAIDTSNNRSLPSSLDIDLSDDLNLADETDDSTDANNSDGANNSDSGNDADGVETNQNSADSGGGCVLGASNSFDPTLLLFVFISLLYVSRRRIRLSR